MDFMIPKPPDGDPADDWKKDSSKPPPIPDVYKKYAFGHGISFELADKIAVRFTELGFDPTTIEDKEMFGVLFISQENCLMVTRRLSPVDQTYYVTGHRFLERKKK